jgi:hypothetical protein
MEAFKRGGAGVNWQRMQAPGLRGNADDASRQVPEREAQAHLDQ